MPIDFNFETKSPGGNPAGGSPEKQRPDTAAGAAPESPGRNSPRNPEKVTIPADTGNPVIVNIPDPNIPEKKPRKPRAPKVKTDLKDLESNIAALTQGVYGMSAKLLKSDIFEISEDEARQIAEPLARIVDKMQFTEAANKYSDSAALIMAVTIVTMPRIMMYAAAKPKKQKTPKLEVKPNDKSGTPKESIETNTGSNKAGIAPVDSSIFNDPFNINLGGY